MLVTSFAVTFLFLYSYTHEFFSMHFFTYFLLLLLSGSQILRHVSFLRFLFIFINIFCLFTLTLFCEVILFATNGFLTVCALICNKTKTLQRSIQRYKTAMAYRIEQIINM